MSDPKIRPVIFLILLLFFPERLLLGEDIVVGMSAAFSGPSKGLGIELYRGSTAYLEHVNRTGGVYGQRIAIKAYDDGYNPTPAIQNTIKLIEQDNAFLLFNYVGTPTVTRILPLLKSYRKRFVYLFTPFTGAQSLRQPPYGEYVFNLRASYSDETEGLVDHLVAAGRSRIAVFYQADAYGRSGWDGVKKALAKNFGFKMVGEATYRRGAEYSQNFTEQVEVIKKASADAVICIGAYAVSAAFIRDARKAGLNIPIANLSFVGSENMTDLLLRSSQTAGKDYTKDLINSQVVPSYQDTVLPAVQEYRQLMEKYQPLPPRDLTEGSYSPLPYSYVSFEGFLNAKLLVEVLKRMGPGPTKSRIKESIERINSADLGIDTPITFGPHKHQGLDKVYYTTMKDNQFVPLADWQGWEK
ncbi:MAG TPA: ABC transporter substrate-binding protein [Candidatus Binatia bacterium]